MLGVFGLLGLGVVAVVGLDIPLDDIGGQWVWVPIATIAFLIVYMMRKGSTE
jgi:hypothetical protein